MSQTYLITGGAGFIGSNLTELLIKNNNKVICIDNFDSFYSRDVKENNLKSVIDSPLFTLIEGDIRDEEMINSIFKRFPVDMVIHLAAKTGVRPSIQYSKEYFDVNVIGTLVLLEAMKTFNIKKMVFASSSSVYGNNKKIPYEETDNVDYPISPYAASKKSCELLTHNYHHLYNFKIINLRLFTVYGPRQRPDLAIHKFFKAIYKSNPIELFGDGTTSRDYTFIEDILQGFNKAIEYVETHEHVYETINLGNNSPAKLNELIGNIESVTNKKFIINKISMQPGDVNHTYASIEKAGKLLQYSPATSLIAGLTRFKNWYEENN